MQMVDDTSNASVMRGYYIKSIIVLIPHLNQQTENTIYSALFQAK